MKLPATESNLPDSGPFQRMASGAGAARREPDSGSPDHDALLGNEFESMQPELLGTVYYIVGNREAALDVLQEAFVKCWRHRDRVDEIGNLRGWIYRIVSNTARDYRKSPWSRRRRDFEDLESIVRDRDATPHAADRMIDEEERLQLSRAITRLAPGDREIFLLRQNGELTFEQIADQLSLPVGTVKTRMRSVLKTLRQQFGGES